MSTQDAACHFQAYVPAANLRARRIRSPAMEASGTCPDRCAVIGRLVPLACRLRDQVAVPLLFAFVVVSVWTPLFESGRRQIPPPGSRVASQTAGLVLKLPICHCMVNGDVLSCELAPRAWRGLALAVGETEAISINKPRDRLEPSKTDGAGFAISRFVKQTFIPRSRWGTSYYLGNSRMPTCDATWCTPSGLESCESGAAWASMLNGPDPWSRD